MQIGNYLIAVIFLNVFEFKMCLWVYNPLLGNRMPVEIRLCSNSDKNKTISDINYNGNKLLAQAGSSLWSSSSAMHSLPLSSPPCGLLLPQLTLFLGGINSSACHPQQSPHCKTGGMSGFVSIHHAAMPTGGNQEEGEVSDLLPQVLPQVTDSTDTSIIVPKSRLCPFLVNT